jgi:hypothetical protein
MLTIRLRRPRRSNLPTYAPTVFGFQLINDIAQQLVMPDSEITYVGA